LALLAMAGVVVAAVKLTSGPDLARVAAGLGLPLAYVQLAAKNASKNGLPLEWVLATILVESSGNPRGRGDADGRSVGLMQVNVVAHAKDVTAAQMLDPAQNIAWGTRYLAEFKEGVLSALAGRTPPAPLDELTRLAYKGPTAVYSALAKGQNPLRLSWAPAAIVNWRREMARVAALTKGRQTV
jgi:Transglycosylase SLT domain